ncbi:inositol monophosphatase family protein [Vreelandella populi]|uniref:Inositol-1-monophosphatase n=1 Tax=Vreelandella populi TaxID=2498858 RepID=A0A3S1E6K9_9GAMM|nr:inositol monophosphatase [Halomonas populi]RUR36534.1 inositol monophosphatase [Halomonas populi]RUR44995.1 inositol monophosphatase [Halomonas populi]RUR51332.1 inositol monophosphatase [Halomonas populi]
MPILPHELEVRAEFLKDMIQRTGLKARHLFETRKPGLYTLKGHQDFLTEADTFIEQEIQDAIQQHFPIDAFLGEESGGQVNGNAIWVVDPIDGTANYARGIPHFCVCIAFIDRGKTQLGAIFNPCTDELYFTQRGKGAYKNAEAIHVAATHDFTTATIEMGWSTRTELQTYLNAQAALLSHGANVRRGASGALALAWVAEGRIDGYLEHHMHPWDSLAGLLLVREAGGVTRPYLSLSGTLNTGGAVLAAAPHIADALTHYSQLEELEIA